MKLIKKRIEKVLDTEMTASSVLKRINREYPIRKEKLSAVENALRALLADGKVILKDGKYSLKRDTISGVFHGTSRGYGFVTPEDGGDDYFIPPGKTGGAWHGDYVMVSPRGGRRANAKTEGSIEKIVKSANKYVTGRIIRTKNGSYLEPDNGKLPERIGIERAKNVKNGDKAALKIISRGVGPDMPSGVLHRVFGKDGALEAAVAAVLFSHGIETYFPDSVKTAAAKMPESIDAGSVTGRLDLRDELIFTIDGDYAKDLDDAVGIKETEKGYILSVHIADVAHYVESGSILDREAYERGTSVYFADRVIPMLPPELSNGICSLNPGVDRLTMSVIMTIDKNGSVCDYKLSESVIHSKARMTYNDCNAILAGDPEVTREYEHIKDTLFKMSDLAEILLSRRIARGALEFETTQSVIICGEDGRPTDIFPAERGVSEKIIEEFMIIANETVAEHMQKLEKPAVYRIHEKPDADKMAAFAAVAANFGYTIGSPAEITPKKLQILLNAAQGTPEERALNTFMLRSLMKARYCAENLGHFGLASQYYCHFTSPIRRYPDLVMHRFLKLTLSGLFNDDTEKRAHVFAVKAAEQSSERELKAMTAEREAEKIYKADYMSAHIGETFEGVISGVQPFRLFIELPNSVEGFLPVEKLDGGDYFFDEKTFTLTCIQDKGRQYKLGQPVSVTCAGASVASGQVEFRLPDY